MEESVKILLLEDNLSDVELVHRQIVKAGIKFQWLHTSKLDAFTEALSNFKPDIILSDYNLVGFTGLDALEVAKQKCPLIPFIIVTGTLDEETAVETIKKGAWDYIVKERLIRLGTAINNAIEKQKTLEAKNKAEEDVKEREQHLTSIIQNPIGYLIYRLKAGTDPMSPIVTHVSPSITEIVGIRPEDSRNYPLWFQNVFPEDLPRLIEANIRGMKPPFIFEEEFRFNHPQKGLIWLQARSNGIPYTHDPDNIEWAHGIIIDITERKKNEVALIESELSLNQAQEIAKMGSWEQSFIDQKTTWSKNCFTIYGYKPFEFEPTFEHFKSRVHPDDWHVIEKNIEVARKSKMNASSESRIVYPDGTIKWLYNNVAPIFKDDKLIKLKGINIDITKRKLAEEELQQSNVFRDSLLKTIPFGMHIVDESGTVLFRSANLKELIGENDIGKKCWEIYRDDQTQCSDCPLHKGIKVGETATCEAHNVLGNRIFDIIHTGMMFNGKKAILEIFQDITGRKEAEKELFAAKEKAEHSEKLKTAFLMNMSHEIRTPLNAIIGFSELLTKSNLKDKEKILFSDYISSNGHSLAKIIDDIIDISMLQSKQLKIKKGVFNLHTLLTELEIYYGRLLVGKSKNQVKIELVLPKSVDNEFYLESDEHRLKQILNNLISNAIKYTQKGKIEFGYKQIERMLQFYVKDTGVGIAPKNISQIFERFVQYSEQYISKQEGTGLGLSICKNLVELLGGEINVESELKKGSQFYFQIPYTKSNPPKKEESLQAIKNDRDLSKYKILIADDEDSNYVLTKRLLEHTKVKSDWAVNGKQALEMVANTSYDLVLMDIKMPLMDGIEATRLIKKYNTKIPVIIQTAFAMPEAKKRARQAGCDGFIVKPISIGTFIELVNKHIK